MFNARQMFAAALFVASTENRVIAGEVRRGANLRDAEIKRTASAADLQLWKLLMALRNAMVSAIKAGDYEYFTALNDSDCAVECLRMVLKHDRW